MRKGLWILLALTVLLGLSLSCASAEVRVDAPAEAEAGGIVDVLVRAGEGAETVTYTLTCDGKSVFQGKPDTHFASSFRPRQEGRYALTAEVTYADGRTETGEAAVTVSGQAEEKQTPDTVYSQKDGWWKDKEYSKSELDNAGCAIFTLSHALLRMGWTGEEIRPEQLAVTHRNCYTKNGTANARLIYNASQIYGYATKTALMKDASGLREGLKNGDMYSFSIVLGHIALMTGVDEKAGKVRVVDSAPSATFERIKKGTIYYLKDGAYLEAKDPGEIPGSRYYFETCFYGGLEYYLDLSYCARRGGRLIRPAWLFWNGEGSRIGAVMVNLTSGESDITVNGEERTVPTRELSWGEEGKPRIAAVTQEKTIRLLNDSGKRIASVPAGAVLPVFREEEDRAAVLYGDQRGYVRLADVEVGDPLSGEIRHGTVSVNGNTSGRATVKLRFGPSEKERVAASWKTGTKVIVLREENGFFQVEGKGLRLWIHKDYLTAE